MKKRIVSFLLTAVMGLSVLSCFSVSADSLVVYLYTKEDLADIMDDPYGDYVLANDIVFEADDFSEGGAFYNDGAGFLPLGDGTDEYFEGTLDGNGHSIKNLKITPTVSTNDFVYVGLFECVGNGEIKNLNLENITVNVTLEGEAVNDSDAYAPYIGALAGECRAAVTDCTVTGSVSFTAVLDYPEGGTRHPAIETYVGGVFGYGYNSRVVGVVNNASVTVDCRYTDFNSTSNQAIAAYVGGIGGWNISSGATSPFFKECRNNGNVTVTTDSNNGQNDVYAGGIVGDGRCGADGCTNTAAVTVNAKNSKKITVYGGGIAGDFGDCGITKCSNGGNITLTTFVNDYSAQKDTVRAGGIIGVCSSLDGGLASDCVNSGGVSASSVSGTAYAGGIGAIADMAVKGCTNKGTVLSGSVYGKAYAGGIVADHTGDSVDRTLYKNFENCNNMGEVTASSQNSSAYAAGIAVYIHGNDNAVEKCANTAQITATGESVYAAGIVSYAYNISIAKSYNIGKVCAVGVNDTNVYAGGIAAKIRQSSEPDTYGANIENCYNAAAVSGESQSGKVYCAGIVANLDTQWPSVSVKNVSTCYNVGDITGSTSGKSEISDIKASGNGSTDCCYYITHDPLAEPKGTNPYTVTELCNELCYDGFDFDKVWTMGSGDNYHFATLRDVIHYGDFPCEEHEFGEYVYNNDASEGSSGTKTRRCIHCGKPETVTAEGGDVVQIQDTSIIFTDVKVGKWYKPAVDYAYSYKFISGMTETEFGVSTTITRGMFITILARMAGVDTSTGANNNAKTKFTDVPQGKYYTAAIKWASENGIVGGMSETTFEPNTPIQRQQLAVMIVNFAKNRGVTLGNVELAVDFTDSADIARWAKEAVKVCQMADIVNGYGTAQSLSFKPKNTATRAEAAQILYKFHKDFFNR